MSTFTALRQIHWVRPLGVLCGLAIGSAAVLAQTAAPVPGPVATAPAPLPEPTEQQLVGTYSGFVGSEAGVRALVRGLRTGSSVTLASPSAPTETFTPSTALNGLGNINIALSLAQASLQQQGITQPTPSQLAAALNGGTVTGTAGSVNLQGVLSQRAAGQGWGQIAQALGVKLGALVSASKTTHAKAAQPAPATPAPSKSAKAGAEDGDNAKKATAERGATASGGGSKGGQGGGGRSGGSGGGGGGGGGNGRS